MKTLRNLATLLFWLLTASCAFGAPTITNVLITASTGSTATIQWTTNTASTSQLLYGTSLNLNFSNTVDQTLVTSHSMTLTLLSPGTLYYTAAVSRDSSGASQSTTITFSLCGNPSIPVSGAINNYYEYGTYQFTWVPPAGATSSPTVCGQALTQTVSGSLSGGASFNTQVSDASKVVPGPGQWQVSAADVGNIAPISTLQYLTFVSGDVTAALQQQAATSGLSLCWVNTITSAAYPSTCGGGGGPGTGVTSLNALTGAVTLVDGLNSTVAKTGQNLAINVGAGIISQCIQTDANGNFVGSGSLCNSGSGGSGTVNPGGPWNSAQYGLSQNTQAVQPNPNLYELNSTMSTSQINFLIGTLAVGGGNAPWTQNGTVIVPDGVPFSTQWTNAASIGGITNPGVNMDDIRLGVHTTPLSTWNVVCNVRTQGAWTFTSGSNQVSPSFNAFYATDVGSTIAIMTTVGGIPTRFTPTIIAVNSGTGVATISTNSPFSGTVGGELGYLNTATMQNAMAGLGTGLVGQVPSGCGGNNAGILIANVSWSNAQSIVGDSPSTSEFYTIPGADAFINTDVATASAFSITSNVVTMAASNSYGINQSVTLHSFTTGTYFNGQTVTIIAATPSQVQFGFSHANVTSTTDAGYITPNSGVTGRTLEFGKFTINLDDSIDISNPWQTIDANGTTVAQTPVYRPLCTQGDCSNNPLGPGWAVGATNGVASITQNSAVICVPNALGRMPLVGQQIVFRDTTAVFQSTVSSLTGSGCASGFSPATMAAAMTNTSGYTQAQSEWVSTSSVQNLANSISAGTLTYPFTITVANSTARVPGFESNVATHGWLKIGSEEYGYIGGSTTSPYTFVIRTGPGSTAGWAAGTAVVPLNPCYAARNVPWPVTPTVNSGDSTPSGAVYFPGECGGVAAIAMPSANALEYVGNGFSNAFIHDLVVIASLNNPATNSACYYMGGNNASYDTTYDNIQCLNTQYGIVQGPASKGQHGVAGVGPTGDGNHYKNLVMRNANHLIFDELQGTTIDRVDGYTTGYNPYDGTAIGAVMAFDFGYTLDEQTGGLVSNTADIVVSDCNSEPENGSHIEVPVYAELDSASSVYQGCNFEGIPSMLGGGNNLIEGGQFSTPAYNYGVNNVVRDTNPTYSGQINPSATGSYITNWGVGFNASVPFGTAGGPKLWGANNVRGSSDGQTTDYAYQGDFLSPSVDPKGSMVWADEFVTSRSYESAPFNIGPVFDPTAQISGHYVGCTLTGSNSCFVSHFAGNSLLYIGPQQRVPADSVDIQITLMNTSGSASNVAIFANAISAGSCSGGTFFGKTVPTTSSWTTYEIFVTLASYSGCNIGIGLDGPTAGTTLIQSINFLPVPSRVLMRNQTYTAGATCNLYGSILGMDGSGNLYTCPNGTVVSTSLTSGGGGGGITALTGDVVGSGSGTVATTVKSTNGGPLFTSQGTGPECNSGATGQLNQCTNLAVSGYLQVGSFTRSGLYAVPCTNTPVFDLGQGDVQYLTLGTGCAAVSSSSLVNPPTGTNAQRFTTIVCQDSTGGRPFPTPTWAQGWTPVNLGASQCTSEMFTYASGQAFSDNYNSAQCASSASPAVCGQAYKGYIVIPSGTNPTLTVDTTAVGPMSIFYFQPDNTLGSDVTPTVTCTAPTSTPGFTITARTTGTSFTVEAVGTYSGNLCVSYTVTNP